VTNSGLIGFATLAEAVVGTGAGVAVSIAAGVAVGTAVDVGAVVGADVRDALTSGVTVASRVAAARGFVGVIDVAAGARVGGGLIGRAHCVNVSATVPSAKTAETREMCKAERERVPDIGRDRRHCR
jgi:hypothetical protein